MPASDEIFFLATNRRILAISKADGHAVWTTVLPGKFAGHSFVTLAAAEPCVFAHCNGHLYGLDYYTGRVLWTNELPGCGYGIASLAVPGQPMVPDAATVAAVMAQQQSTAGTSAATT